MHGMIDQALASRRGRQRRARESSQLVKSPGLAVSIQSMKKPKQRGDELNPSSITPLRDDQLARVTGGEGTVSPRDPASGLPTGKRM